MAFVERKKCIANILSETDWLKGLLSDIDQICNI